MKETDLMIGDWVRFPNSIERVQEISYVCGKGYCASFAASATLFPISIDKIKPIPLTSEILEKNGFYYDEDRKAYLMGVIFQIKPEKLGLFSFEICGCPYPLNTVHELQHALRLCGIEKE